MPTLIIQALLSLSLVSIGFSALFQGQETTQRLISSSNRKISMQQQTIHSTQAFRDPNICANSGLVGVSAIPKQMTRLKPGFLLMGPLGNPIFDPQGGNLYFDLTLERECPQNVNCLATAQLDVTLEQKLGTFMGTREFKSTLYFDVTLKGEAPNVPQTILDCSMGFADEPFIYIETTVRIALTFVDCSGSSEFCNAKVIDEAGSDTDLLPGAGRGHNNSGIYQEGRDDTTTETECFNEILPIIGDDLSKNRYGIQAIQDWALAKYGRRLVSLNTVSIVDTNDSYYKVGCGFTDRFWTVGLTLAKIPVP